MPLQGNPNPRWLRQQADVILDMHTPAEGETICPICGTEAPCETAQALTP